MKTWQYLLFIGGGIAVFVAIINLVPQTNQLVRGILMVLKWIWFGLSGFLVALLIFCFGGVLGYLLKAFGVAFLDSKLEKGKELNKLMHWGIAIVFGLICGFGQTLLMPKIMVWDTWVRRLAIFMDWPGVYETLPIFWLFFCLGVFVIVYLMTSYAIKQPEEGRYR